MAKSVGSLKLSFVFSLLVAYCPLMILFQGYIFPAYRYYPLTGIVTLSGGGVNDALVLT